MTETMHRREVPLRMVSRETVRGDGDSEIENLVACPRRGATPLDVCLECEHSEGFVQSDGGRRAFLVCSVPHGDSQVHEVDRWAGPDEIPVSAIMTTTVVCVREDLCLDALARLFLERNISGAPVVDSIGRPTGVVSKTDLVADPARTWSSASVIVRDIMMPVAFTVGPHASISQVSALMVTEGVHRIPVVSDDGTLIGIVSTLDVLRWLARRDRYAV